MKVEIVTKQEAVKLGITHSRLLYEDHGAFGESDNSYEDIVYVGDEKESLSDDDLVVFKGKSPNREVIQVLSEWNCSNKLLEILNPKAFNQRKKDRYQRYLELKKEFENK